MPILRQDHPNIGCLAVPISAVGGFLLFALLAAAVGFGSGESGVVGIGGAAVGALVAFGILRR